MNVDLKRVKLIVSGRVQGVGFRYFCYKQAIKLNVKGYAKNLLNGKVEIIAEGQKKDLQNFIDMIEKGPSLSRVEKIDKIWENYIGEYKDFQTL